MKPGIPSVEKEKDMTTVTLHDGTAGPACARLGDGPCGYTTEYAAKLSVSSTACFKEFVDPFIFKRQGPIPEATHHELAVASEIEKLHAASFKALMKNK